MRILVVDDDEILRQAIRIMLERAEHEVFEAQDGKSAIWEFRRLGADLILCDLFMPERDGLELIRELRSEFPNLKIIAMSGGGHTGQVDLLPMAKHLGATAILHKPFDQAALLTVMKTAFHSQA